MYFQPGRCWIGSRCVYFSLSNFLANILDPKVISVKLRHRKKVLIHRKNYEKIDKRFL